MEKTKFDFIEFIKSLLIAGVLAFFIITFIAQSFVVKGSSMEPNFHNGERLFVNKFIYNFKNIERFDIVVFTPKINKKVKYIKRVIGLPGETISIRNNTILINGKPLKNNNKIKEKMNMNKVYFPKTKIPKNHVFVMGDNRNNSLDSTEFGPISINSISGEAFWVYWPITKMRFINS